MLHKKSRGDLSKLIPKQSNINENMRVHIDYEDDDKKKETNDGRELLEKDECRLI